VHALSRDIAVATEAVKHLSSVVMDPFKQLLIAQNNTETLILRILPNYHKLAKTKRTATAIRSRLNNLKTYWETFQVQHTRLCAAADAESKRDHEYFTKDKFLTISDAVEDITDTLSENLELLQPTTAQLNLNESSMTHELRHSIVQLPRIDIPKFSGDITKWESFRDVFDSLVSNRTDLSNVQKLHYLKANLTGDASLILANTQVTDANYSTAWELLKKRYDNTRAIVNAHLQAFMDIPCASSQSVSDLKNLRDKTSDIYTALLNLKRPVDQWEDLMIFVTVSKLDKITRRDWELALGDDTEIPDFERLDIFLTSRIRALDATQGSTHPSSKSDPKRVNKAGNVKVHQVSSTTGKCVACEGNHPLHHCKTFLNQTTTQRIDLLKRHKCCFNCLRQGHLPWACRSKNVCTHCKSKHHSLIHREKNATEHDALPSTAVAAQTSGGPTNSAVSKQDLNKDLSASCNSFAKSVGCNTLLPTALVLIKSSSGRALRVRALLDQGSQASFITESVVQILRAEQKPVSVDVSGIGGARAGVVKKLATFTVEPCSLEGPVLSCRAFILPRLTSYRPGLTMFAKQCPLLSSLPLADPNPNSQERIDLLIGADYYGAILRDGLIKESHDSPTAQLTIFGWVISGSISNSSQRVNSWLINVHHGLVSDPLNESLRNFWELEEVPTPNLMSDEEVQCEKHFVETHFRLPDGR